MIPLNGTKRVFFAVGIPSEAREKIAQEFLPGLPNGVKPVEKENLHFTLMFIGICPEKKIPGLVEAAKGVSFKPFEAEISGLGKFGSRIIWLGLSSGAEELSEIARGIEKGIGFAEHEFSPHLTIARNRSLGATEFAELARRLGAKKFSEKFMVNGFELMESELSASGPKYRIINSFSFA